MAYKEVFRVEIAEVIRRWQAAVSVRGLARTTGLSRSTIKKYIQAAESCGLARDGPPPTESQLVTLVQLNVAGRRQVSIPTEKVLESRADLIRQWLKEEPRRVRWQGIQHSLFSVRSPVSLS